MVRSFIDFAVINGANHGALLELTGLIEKDLEIDDGRLPLELFENVVRISKALTRTASLPILFASHADFSEVSIAGLIANSSRTMLDALVQLNRYSRLAFDTPVAGKHPLCFERTEAADWIVERRALPNPFPELTEITFTYLIAGPRRFLSEPHVIEVQVTHEEPEHRNAYDEVWNCPVHFNAPVNAIRLPKWVADQALNLQPSYAFGILTQHADQLLEQMNNCDSFAAELQTMILASLHTGEVSIDWVANQLKTSRQSIYRKLKSEKTTFRELHDGLRKQLALRYLKAGKVSAAEVVFTGIC
jgi:AraC-like DNA-binding protein